MENRESSRAWLLVSLAGRKCGNTSGPAFFVCLHIMVNQKSRTVKACTVLVGRRSPITPISSRRFFAKLLFRYCTPSRGYFDYNGNICSRQYRKKIRPVATRRTLHVVYQTCTSYMISDTVPFHYVPVSKNLMILNSFIYLSTNVLTKTGASQAASFVPVPHAVRAIPLSIVHPCGEQSPQTAVVADPAFRAVQH